ncbi:MAG: hypothetical protein AMXMBFR13_02550 [Phycisphaerae bacterium]
MQLRSTGRQRLARLGQWGLASALAVATSVTAWASTGPMGTDVSASQVLIALDPNVPASQAEEQLSQAGFSVNQVEGLPNRFSNFRLVNVNGGLTQSKAALLEVPGVQAVRPVFQRAGLDHPFLPNGQVIVRFEQATTFSQVTAVVARHGATVARAMALPQAYVLNIDERTTEAHVLAQAISAEPSVKWAQVSVLLKLNKHQVASTVQDPLYPFQWHLHNTAQLPGGVVDADIDAPEAWTITEGAGAVVAVLDDSVQRDHEDLAENYLTGFDFFDQDGDPSPSTGPTGFDASGDAHGTLVAGLIAAAANNVGVRGVAPRAKLIGCRIGSGFQLALDQDVADAFLFAEQNGAMVINNSWGWPGGAVLPVIPSGSLLLPNPISEAITEVATNGRGGRGVLVLFSSGNEDLLLSYGNMYAALPNVMAVGATLRDDKLACYSNFGEEQSVVAPGGGVGLTRDQRFGWLPQGTTCYDYDIATTDVAEVPSLGPDLDGDGVPDAGRWPCRGINPAMKFLNVIFCPDPTLPLTECYVPLVPDLAVTDFPQQNYTQRFAGTSASCPVASGVAALVFAVNPNLSAVEVRNLIEHTADKVTTPNERFDPVTGHNVRYGHGRVNAHRAVLAAQRGDVWPSPVKHIQSVGSQAFVQLLWTNPDWNNDGVTDTDVAGILVVRGPAGSLNWAPLDGFEYTVGQQVAPGVSVVANGLISSLDQTGLPAGEFEYAIFVRNGMNFYSWGRRTTFHSSGSVDVPLASIQASVTRGPAPLTVHFAGGGIDAGGIVGFRWDFGDGSTGTGAFIDHTYTRAGRYTATLTVTNRGGQTATTTAVITVLSGSNELPTARITATPVAGEAPLVVLFQASATDADGSVVRYDWDFGNGKQGTGQAVEHTYLDPGVYGVTLTVTDDAGGEAMDSVLINVVAPTTTAADTVPSDLLSGGAPACGGGMGGAALASLAGLCGLIAWRRRI